MPRLRTTSPSAPPARIAHLDGLRGVAILLVVLFHAYSGWQGIEPFTQSETLRSAFSYGWLGVNLFFAISGYVIHRSLVGCSSILEFAIKRYLRLAPTLLIASIFIYISAHWMPERPDGTARLIDFLPSLTFIDPRLLSAILHTDIHSLDSAFWTLYIEAIFYSLAGLCFFLLKDKSLRLILSLYAAHIIIDFLYSVGAETASLLVVKKYFVYTGIEYYSWFLIGVYTHQHIRTRDNKYKIAITSMSALSLLDTPFNRENTTALLVLEAIIIFIFISSMYSIKIKRIFSSESLIFFGFISYPLYLIHQNFVTGMAIEFYRMKTDLAPVLYPIPFMALSIAMAYTLAKSEPALKRLIAHFVPEKIFGITALPRPISPGSTTDG